MNQRSGAHPVVVGVNDSPGARHAAQYAADLAGTRRTDLVVAHAYRLGEPLPPRGTGLLDDLSAAGQRLVDDVVRHLQVPAAVRVSTQTELATPSELLGRMSATAQVVVLGQHPASGLEHLVMGNLAAQIVQHVACPVVVVPEGEPTGWTSSADVVVALDGRSAARPALEYAVAEATGRRSRLVALHALHRRAKGSAAAAEQVVLAELLAGVRQDNPDLEVQTRLLEGDSDDVLAEVSAHAGLLVLSKPAHSWPGAWALSVAHRLVTRSACPLVIVPHEPHRNSARQGSQEAEALS